MSDYISREAAYEALTKYYRHRTDLQHSALREAINRIPTADVLPRDEAIKMGAELAAMHGSDATSQQLEEAYLKGVEDGMTRRYVRSVVRGKWKEDWETGCSECSVCGESYLWEDYDGVGEWNFCPNCGADMREKS